MYGVKIILMKIVFGTYKHFMLTWLFSYNTFSHCKVSINSTFQSSTFAQKQCNLNRFVDHSLNTVQNFSCMQTLVHKYQSHRCNSNFILQGLKGANFSERNNIFTPFKLRQLTLTGVHHTMVEVLACFQHSLKKNFKI